MSPSEHGDGVFFGFGWLLRAAPRFLSAGGHVLEHNPHACDVDALRGDGREFGHECGGDTAFRQHPGLHLPFPGISQAAPELIRRVEHGPRGNPVFQLGLVRLSVQIAHVQLAAEGQKQHERGGRNHH